MMVDLVKSKLKEIKALCSRHFVEELYLFGSAATGSFNNDSDVDFAVIFDSSLEPIARGDAFFGLLFDLKDLLQIPVDLVSYQSIKNPIFKEELDNSKVTLYAA